MTDETTAPAALPKRGAGHRRPKTSKTAELSTRKRIYAGHRASGKSKAEAGRAVGIRKAHAWQWEQDDPKLRELIEKLIREQMTADECLGRLAAQARGQLPTKVTRAGGKDRVEFDMLPALTTVAKTHQLFADDAPPPQAPGSGGAALVLQIPPDKLAKLAAAAVAVLMSETPAPPKEINPSPPS